MSDVGSRTPKQSLLQRKASHPGSDGQNPDERNYEGYYGEDGWWEEDGYHHFGSYDSSYYEEWHGEGRDDIFEVDLYSMVFVLDENLMPKDMYNGFEFEEKTFLFTIEAEDVTPSTPAAWKSRPLKIHPEPPPFRKDLASTPPARSGAATDANTGGSNTPTGPGGRTPRQKVAIPPKVETPKESLPPPATTPPRRPVEPPSKEDSEQSGDEMMDGKAAKIHINNKQLEHLKQKMQALKQRRASLPEKSDDKDGKDKADKDKKEKKDKEKVEKEKEKNDNHKKDEAHTNGPKRTEGTVHSNCPGAHGLSLFKTPARGWWCSVCEKEHDKGSAFYGCRTCDYDECEACAMTPRPKAQAAPQVEKEPEKPSAPVEASRTNNSNSTPAKTPRAGPEKNSTPPQNTKKVEKKCSSSSSSSSSSSGDSASPSPSRSPTPSPSPKKKETKKDKRDSKKKANSKEKNVKKGDAKREEKGDKRKAAKVKVKKTVKRPCKAKSKSRSDDVGSDDKAKKKSKNQRKTKRAASDPKLVPRKPKDTKDSKEESREPKRRKEEKEVSPKKAARSRSRDSDSSQSEEPPKKRAANALTVASEPRAPVSLTRASAARRNEEEKPVADEARGRQGRGAGGDLLRRVLRANAVHNARQDGGPTRSKDGGEPRATLVPPTRKDESSSEESAPRGAATLRPPQDRGIKKAAEARKSRRV